MIGENLWRSSRGSIDVLPGNLPEGTEERLEKRQAEIGAKYLPNTSIQRYRYTSPIVPRDMADLLLTPIFPWDMANKFVSPIIPWDTADFLLTPIFPRDTADSLITPSSHGIRPIF